MPAEPDPRLLRLLDLKDYEHIVITCRCGRSVEYLPGFLQRRHRLSSATLVYDLQYLLRCTHCRADRGFEIVIRDIRNRWDNSKACPERIIVARN